MLPHLLDLYKKWSNRSVMRLWMGPIPIFVLGSAESVEVRYLLSSINFSYYLTYWCSFYSEGYPGQ